MLEYEVSILRKACEEMALKNIILSSRIDDLEARFEHVRAMAFNAALEVSKLVDNPDSESVSPSP